MLLPLYCHDIVMLLSCDCHVAHCHHFHDCTMLLSCSSHAITMLSFVMLLPCSCHVLAMILPCFCLVLAMSLALNFWGSAHTANPLNRHPVAHNADLLNPQPPYFGSYRRSLQPPSCGSCRRSPNGDFAFRRPKRRIVMPIFWNRANILLDLDLELSVAMREHSPPLKTIYLLACNYAYLLACLLACLPTCPLACLPIPVGGAKT
jgi:hypothetical protein